MRLRLDHPDGAAAEGWIAAKISAVPCGAEECAVGVDGHIADGFCPVATARKAMKRGVLPTVLRFGHPLVLLRLLLAMPRSAR